MGQLEKDEIEDVTDEMLNRLVKEGKTIAVLFCKLCFGIFFMTCKALISYIIIIVVIYR